MQVTWQEHERSAWDAAHRSAGAALQQDWAYGEALASLGAQCLRARVCDGDDVLAQAQFLCRRVGAVAALALCTRGPVWVRPAGTREKAAACRALAASLPMRRPRFMLVSPEESSAADTGLPPWRRVMTGHATVMIDLTRQTDELRAAMDGKWRNRLAAAERSALRVQRNGTRPAQYRWLVDREATQRTDRAYRALPHGFVEAFQNACGDTRDAVLTLRADLGRDAAAAMMFLVHGEAATYHLGWSGDEGRKLGAHNLLLWQAVQELKARGVRDLDLGGVNTQRSAGIARFKIGSGGQVVTLAGTWLA